MENSDHVLETEGLETKEFKNEKQKSPVVEVLQIARGKELYAITQYLSHHEQLELLDYSKLADNMKDIAIQEMQHAGILATRIKNLLCEPVDFDNTEIAKQEKPLLIFDFDAKVEEQAIADYNQFLMICRENKDAISSSLFEKLIADEQQHFDYFYKVKGLIFDLGEAYLATQANALISAMKGNL